jgi:hypothetical protein
MSSPSPFKSGSPDALSKRLKQCRSRRERQLIMESYEIEKREEIRMEKARLTALRLVKHKEELEKEEAELWTSGWIEESTKQMSVRPKTPKKRKERAVLKTPEERKVFNYANRLGFDGKLFEVTKINKGKQICISRKSPDIIPAVNVDGNIVITENFLLYHRLKAMNLRDPETIEKIKKACSSPQKTTKDSGK